MNSLNNLPKSDSWVVFSNHPFPTLTNDSLVNLTICPNRSPVHFPLVATNHSLAVALLGALRINRNP